MLGIFILAFSFSFHITLMDQKLFNKFGWAYLKTFTMSTGEFDYAGIFRGETPVKLHVIPIVTFVALVMVMSIVLMNMLIGIAVDNISKVQMDAEVERVCSQIELVLEMRRPWYKLFTSFYKRTLDSIQENVGIEIERDCKNAIFVKKISNNTNLKIPKGIAKIRNHISMKHFMSAENILKSYEEKKKVSKSDFEKLEEMIGKQKQEIKEMRSTQKEIKHLIQSLKKCE